MNSVVMIGRITKDFELKQGNTLMTSFNIAISREGENDKTDFPRITVFGKQAENCVKYLGRGSLVGILGRVQTGQYTDKEGRTVYTTDIVANRVEFLSPKKQDESGEDYTHRESYSRSDYFNERPF